MRRRTEQYNGMFSWDYADFPWARANCRRLHAEANTDCGDQEQLIARSPAARKRAISLNGTGLLCSRCRGGCRSSPTASAATGEAKVVDPNVVGLALVIHLELNAVKAGGVNATRMR